MKLTEINSFFGKRHEKKVKKGYLPPACQLALARNNIWKV